MSSARVLILYNEPILPAGHPDYESEHEIVHTVEVVGHDLVEAGFEVTHLGISRDPGVLVAGLREQQPDVVFNLFEGTADDGNSEADVAGLLEWMRVAFTGSPSRALCLARSKHLTKYLLQGAKLPTPEFFAVEKLPVPDCRLQWPVIVKPAQQDASVGVDQRSVVSDQEALNKQVASVLGQYGSPVLVEEFIPGRELNVALVEAPELRMLQISEVLFLDEDPASWPIVTYDAKWKPSSREYAATPVRSPADVAPELAERLEALACRAFRLLGCRDYARVDFRVSRSGKPYLLEVNPNPDLNPTAGLTGGVVAVGLSHAQLTVALAQAALTRAQSSGQQRLAGLEKAQHAP